MRAKIDHSLCKSHFTCNAIAPEVFEYDDDSDFPAVRADDVPEAQTELVRQAAGSCPEQAIFLDE